MELATELGLSQIILLKEGNFVLVWSCSISILQTLFSELQITLNSVTIRKFLVLEHYTHTRTKSRKPHPSQREEESGHAATIELSPWQKLDVTNQICALRRSHPLSWSTIMSQRV